MNSTLIQQAVSLATSLLLLLASSGCSHDTSMEKPGSARIEIRATDTDGNKITLSDYHLYTFDSEGRGTYSNTFRPGSFISTDDVEHLAIVATTGNGTLIFPETSELTAASLISCSIDNNGNAVPLPALFLSGKTEVKASATLAIPLTCRTTRLRFRVTGELTGLSSLSFIFQEMPMGIRLDGTLPTDGKTSLPIFLEKENDAFIATVNCFPVENSLFEYNHTIDQTGTFSLGQLEAGKSYTVGLTLRDNKIQVGNIIIDDWKNGNSIDGGEAVN